MDDGLTPALLAHLLWARKEGSPQSTGSGRLKGRGLERHETPVAARTAGEDFPATGAERRVKVLKILKKPRCPPVPTINMS